MGKRGGKGSRARSKERRARERRARKASMNAQYQRWAEQGVNQKSKRARTNNKKRNRLSPRTPTPLSEESIPFLIRCKLLQLAGRPHQWSSRYGGEISNLIREKWNSLEEAWEEHGIVPVRTGIPESYTEANWRRV